MVLLGHVSSNRRQAGIDAGVVVGTLIDGLGLQRRLDVMALLAAEAIPIQLAIDAHPDRGRDAPYAESVLRLQMALVGNERVVNGTGCDLIHGDPKKKETSLFRA